jgi:hypothetical protein
MNSHRDKLSAAIQERMGHSKRVADTLAWASWRVDLDEAGMQSMENFKKSLDDTGDYDMHEVLAYLWQNSDACGYTELRVRMLTGA